MTLSFWYRPPPPPFMLRPLSSLYGLARHLHVWMTRPVTAPVPTICVGNVTVGGTGKTPVVVALRHLLADHRPVVLSRGYGGRLGGPVWVDAHHSAYDVGDEPLVLAQDGPVMVAKDRLAGALAIADQGGTLIILDDGLQNRRLTATCNILVIDGAVGFGNGALLPAGPLREPLTDALARTDIAVIVGPDVHSVKDRLVTSGGPIPCFSAHIHADTSGIDPARRYVAFCGIGRPQKFFQSLEQAQANIVDRLSFSDHYAYTKPDVTALVERAATLHATLITTEKDWVKVRALTQSRIDVLPIQCVFDAPDDVRATVLSKAHVS